MGNIKEKITPEDIEAMEILVKRIGFRSRPWCAGVRNYLMETYAMAIREIRKEFNLYK